MLTSENYHLLAGLILNQFIWSISQHSFQVIKKTLKILIISYFLSSPRMAFTRDVVRVRIVFESTEVKNFSEIKVSVAV